MKLGNLSIVGLTIVALVAQGVCGGLVLCVGHEGHVAVETAHEPCCSEDFLGITQSPAFLVLEESGPPDHRTCGPCTDIPISTKPFKIPSLTWRANVNPQQVAMISVSAAVVSTAVRSASLDNPTELPLYLVKTTSLII